MVLLLTQALAQRYQTHLVRREVLDLLRGRIEAGGLAEVGIAEERGRDQIPCVLDGLHSTEAATMATAYYLRVSSKRLSGN